MDRPDHQWHRRLEREIKKMGDRPSLIAERSGVSKATVSQWLKGNTREPNYKTLRAVCQYLGIDVEFVLYGAAVKNQEAAAISRKRPRIPVVGTAQLGEEGYWCELGYPEGHGEAYIDAPVSTPKAYAVRVRGDSMSPAIRDGWYVVIAPDEACHPGEFVLVQTTDGRSIVKELLWQNVERTALMSVADGHGRLTLRAEEIDRIDPVGAIVPPSAAKEIEKHEVIDGF